MPTAQHTRREILLKVVYYGPGLGGKTTNLEWIHSHSRPDHRGKLLQLDSDGERTLFFDLLPVELGTFRGYSIRLHLCTVPGQIVFDNTRKLILRGVDGVVFVADSQAEAVDDNLVSVHNLHVNLRRQGDDPDRIPLVVQYNKRDLPEAMPVDELRSALSIPHGTPEIEAIAREGVGVAETMKAIVRSALGVVRDPAQLPEGRSPSILPGSRVSRIPGAIVPALGMPPLPRMSAPAVPRLEPGDGENEPGAS